MFVFAKGLLHCKCTLTEQDDDVTDILQLTNTILRSRYYVTTHHTVPVFTGKVCDNNSTHIL